MWLLEQPSFERAEGKAVPLVKPRVQDNEGKEIVEGEDTGELVDGKLEFQKIPWKGAEKCRGLLGNVSLCIVRIRKTREDSRWS